MKLHKIIVGLDGSPMSRQALLVALDLAGAETTIIVVSVEESLPQYAALRGEVDENKLAADEYFARLEREAAELAKGYGRTLEVKIKRGHAARQLVDFARSERADLLVIGQSGHSGVWGTFLGTTADKVVRHAPCSVLVVRPTEAPA
jgi:nucleotide-binding universal stress UspA family protein